jgi:hypothetical protein
VAIIFLLCFHGAAISQDVLVPAGAVWRYLDDGSDQGTAWWATAFPDSNWAFGPAQLGYGDGDEATVVSYGPNPNWKYVTTYFRHTFDVTDPGQFAFLVTELLRDDGAVIYLNGTEVVRSNMPDGPIDFETFAASTVSGAEEDRFFRFYIDANLLVSGANCLAVEIHQRSRTSSDISLDLALRSTSEPPPLVRKAPYLIYPGSNTEMQVHWQLYESDTCTIEWGLDTQYSLGDAQGIEYGDDHQQTYTIIDLSPGTTCFYRVTAGHEVHTGSFQAAPDGGATTLKFLAYGDTRSQPEQHNLVAEAMVSTRTEDPAFQSFTAVMGDLVYDGDLEEHWHNQLFDPSFGHIRQLFEGAPYHSAIGNHELPGDLFVKYFAYPFADRRYWSYDYGPVHVTIIDQYTSYYPGSSQYEWLQADLASTTKTWKFICLHEPGWSAGDGHGNNIFVQSYIQPLCEEHGVAFVLGGHNHYYARAVVDGVQHITTGGGGAPLHIPIPGFPYVVASASAYHYCKIEIDGYLLRFAAVTPSGTVLDEFEIDADPSAVPDVFVPRIVLHPAHPNPFARETTIDYEMDAGLRPELLVVNAAGRIVRRLPASGSGSGAFRWDGTDSRGRRLPAGIYFYKLGSPPATRGHRLHLLR